MYILMQLLGFGAGAMIGAVTFNFSPVIVWVHTRKLEFLLNDALLIPALVSALAVFVIGVFGNMRKHGYNRPLIYAIAGSCAILSGLWLSKLLGLAGFLVLCWAFLEDYNVLQQFESSKEQNRA